MEKRIKMRQQQGMTREEAEEEEERFQRMLANTAKAREAIIAKEGKTRGVTDSIDCPICGGVLHYSISGYNGHIHAVCTTDGCVAWME